MLDGVSPEFLKRGVRGRRVSLGRESVFALGLLLEVMIIIAAAVTTGVVYHLTFYGEAGPVAIYGCIGILVALLFEMPLLSAARQHCEIEVAGRRGAARLAKTWTCAFLCLVVIGFLTKTSDQFSRGWLLIYYALGLAALIAFESALRQGLKAAASAGLVEGRRIVVIGTGNDIERFDHACFQADAGLEIVATCPLPRTSPKDSSIAGEEMATLRSVVERARRHGATDVVILSGWPQSDDALSIADMFLDLPVALHLGQVGLAERFPQLHATRLGDASTLTLRHEPMSVLQLVLKRAIDIAVSAVAIALLAPLFLVVALLIRLDSRGPVFFRQRRRGFNHKEFQIWKFRTMTTMDDGDIIVQAKKNDARITRIGRILRKYNIDELPQLINVLLGTMSLVGPRPHAVAHDKQYEQTIARYARRLNVKPGITGWAQIHGCRGETRTETAMQSRIAHDLYYIENWSVALDLYIMVMTVLSRDAYRNAH